MHIEAERKLRRLLRNVTDFVRVTNKGSVEVGNCWPALKNLGDYLEEEFADHVPQGRGPLLTLRLIFSAFRRPPEWIYQGGPIPQNLDDDERKRCEDVIVGWWEGVPRTYEFRFPMPAYSGPELPLRISKGVEIGTEEWPRKDVEEMSPTNRLMNMYYRDGSGPEMATLRVKSTGVALDGDTVESAASRAIFTAKVVLQLGCSLGLFFRSSAASGGGCRRGYFRDVSGWSEEGEMLLPESLRETLNCTINSAEMIATQGNAAARKAEQISRVLERMRYLPAPKGKPPEPHVDQANRIGTAAFWLHDALSDELGASRMVRASIAFEALYGKTKKEEGVLVTLRNRTAYALGKNAIERTNIEAGFEKFYDTRSDVVHRGHLVLSRDQLGQLMWAEELASTAIAREVELLPQVDQAQTAG